MRSGIVSSGLFGLSLAVLSGCGSGSHAGGGSGSGSGGASGVDSGITSGGSSGTGGGSGGFDGLITVDGGGSVGGASGSCSADGDCTGGLVCQPFIKGCVSPGRSCSKQSDCGASTYCDVARGKCLLAGVGNPCDGDSNCVGGTCVANVCQCVGIVQQQETAGALDIYFILDRTASMGTDCAYVQGDLPPVASKACYATYAVPDYLTAVVPAVPTEFAFQFMSLPDSNCDGVPYSTPLSGPTALPLAATDPIIQAISNETFAGGLGTDIEGALRGITTYTKAHQTSGHTVIGVLMTDGDPNKCNTDIPSLAKIVSDHLAATGIRTFIIGMTGATEANLEALGSAGGADPHADFCGSVAAPCHYWSVGDGASDAIKSALNAIVKQSTPLPCNYPLSGLTPPAGQKIDYSKLNVTLTESGAGDAGPSVTTIGQVPGAADCPANVPAWHYDDPQAPKMINLCPSACDLVSSAKNDARVNVALGCEHTVILQ